jgi:anthranilate phosphoribosyltransferase
MFSENVLVSSGFFVRQVLNAAAGLLACELVKGLGEGIALARETQQSGKALDVLDSWVHLSQVC